MQEIADRIGGDQGDVLYFQIATAPHLICGCEDNPHLEGLPQVYTPNLYAKL